MVSKETSFSINISNNDFHKISRKLLYEKYTSGNFCLKNIFTDYLLFNNKCRLTLFFKEFLLSDNSCEFLRHFYPLEDTKTILAKILEIYNLYSKIYPNYIILKENKFLYKNIRKKQKMIDENNKNNEMKKNSSNDNNIYKENELFTLSIRKEIKDFEDNSYINKNNNDSISNKKENYMNTKKINDNWMLISNKNLNQNLNNSKKAKNMSFDSFWTNDTNNLSTILNAINDKIYIDDSKNGSKKKKDISQRNNKKYAKNKNQKKKEVKSSKKKTFKKVIYKKIDNKKLLSDNSRNNNFLKMKNKKIYLNNINTATKPLSSSLSNKNNLQGLGNKWDNMGNHRLLTEKNLEKEIKKNIYYYSIERDTSDKYIGKYLKKFNHPLSTKKKFNSKEISKERTLSIKKNNENSLLKNSKNINNNNLEKYKIKKSPPKEFLKIFLDKKNGLQNIKEENEKNGSFCNRMLYNTNNNFNNLRNKKYFLKKYFTNNNMNQKIVNRRYANNLTECNSQIFMNSNSIKEFNSSCNNENKKTNNDINGKTLNNFHTSNNYYNFKNKNTNRKNYDKNKEKYMMKKQKTEGTFLALRDKILQRGMGTAYIKKKCFSPLSNNYNRKYTLSRSYNFKNENKINNIKNEKLIERQMINSEVTNKLLNIRKNIRKQIIHHENNINEKTFLSNKSINKINNSNNILIMDESQKEIKSNLNPLNSKDKFRNYKKIYLKKNFSPTLTYYNLYKSGNKDLSKPKNNQTNNSEFIEYHHEKLFIKNKNKININNNISSKNILENKENNYRLINQKKKKIKEHNTMTKSRTEYDNFLFRYKNINKINSQKKGNNNHNNFILKRLKKKSNNFYIFSKDKINKSNNLNDIAFQRFNNLSNSALNNNSNCHEFTFTKNNNNSLSNSMNNINELQTPLIQKKRLKLIKKFIYHEQKEKNENISNIENIPSKVTIKVNRAKFLGRVKERMKNKIK